MVLHDKIEELIAEKKYKELKALLDGENPVDIAEALYGLDDKALALAFRLLKKDDAADTFVSMDRDEQDVVEELGVDDAVDIIEEMPANVVSRILRGASADTRKLINEMFLYPEDSAGSIMTPEYVSLKADMSIAEAFDEKAYRRRIRKIDAFIRQR